VEIVLEITGIGEQGKDGGLDVRKRCLGKERTRLLLEKIYDCGKINVFISNNVFDKKY
jgi:hypothetical protein